MARDDLNLKIRALVEGVQEVQQLTDEVDALQKEAGQTIPDSTQKFRRGLDKTQKEARDTSDVMGNLRGTIGAVAGVLGAGALGGKLIQTANEMETVNRQAGALGESVQNFSELSFTFRQFGLQQNDVSDALGTLSDRAEDAQSGMQSFIDDFKLLGVEVDDLRGKRPGELFELVADRVSDIEDPTRRAAGVVRIFGDDLGRRLLPLLIKGSEELERNAEKAREVGAAYDKDAAEGAAEAARALREVREIFDAQFNELVADNADAFVTLAEALAGIVQVGGDVVEKFTQMGQGLGILFAQLQGAGSPIPFEEDIRSAREEVERLEGVLSAIRSGQGGVVAGANDPTFIELQLQRERERLRRLEQQQLDALTDGTARPGTGEEEPEPDEQEDPGAESAADGEDETEIIEGAKPGFGQPGSFRQLAGSERALERHRQRLQAAGRAFEKTRTAAENYNARLTELRTLLQKGYISQQTFNRGVAQAKEELDSTGEQAEETGKELSEFAVSAARNMESAFADFLFDPFENGLEGMADQFVVTLRRMAAQAAAANIMEGVFGGGEGGDSANAGFAQFIGSLFGEAHTGGVVGKTAFPQRSASPLAWAGAPRMHMGGIAGDEVPIIARRGEEILTQDNPRHRDNAGAGGTTIVQNITTPDAQSFRRSRSAVRRDAQLAMGRR